MRPLGIALVLLFAVVFGVVAATPGGTTPAGFVRFMELSRFPIEHAIVQDRRASFFLMSDWLFIEVFLVDEDDTFEIRRTNAYIEVTSGPEFMSCETRGPGVPSDTERLAYVRKWFDFIRHDRLLFVIPKCLGDIPAARRNEAEEIAARFRVFLPTYSPERVAALERERADIDALRDIVLNSRHDLRQRAEELMARISPAALAAVRRDDPEFVDMLHYLLVIQPREEEKERLQAAEQAAFIAKNYPAAIVPELALAPAGAPQVIVSLVNRSDSTVWAFIDGGMLAPDRGNVHFLVWRPGAMQPSEYRPSLWVADVFLRDSMPLGPGESVSHIYDLSGLLTESGLYRLQAVVAYGGAARTNVLEVSRTVAADSAEARRETAPQPLPKSLALSGAHQVHISREWKNDTEARLLAVAEATPARAGNDTMWWCNSFDGTLIAKAITADAVRYYLDLTDAFRHGDFSRTNGIAMTNSQFSYEASVSFSTASPESPADPLYIVTMSMRWHQYCGPVCAMRFELTRKVTLDLDGNVLGVDGDDCAPTEVS